MDERKCTFWRSKILVLVVQHTSHEQRPCLRCSSPGCESNLWHFAACCPPLIPFPVNKVIKAKKKKYHIWTRWRLLRARVWERFKVKTKIRTSFFWLSGRNHKGSVCRIILLMMFSLVYNLIIVLYFITSAWSFYMYIGSRSSICTFFCVSSCGRCVFAKQFPKTI